MARAARRAAFTTSGRAAAPSASSLSNCGCAKIGDWMKRASAAEGISICPETAVCFDILERMVHTGEVQADERVVVFNTGAAPKYLEALPADLPSIDKDRVEWDMIAL